GEAVTAVRSDVQFDDRVAEPEQFVRIRARLGTSRFEHQNARVVGADTQFAHRADHPVGDLPVGLAARDGEPAGKHRAGECGDHEVTFGEVAGTAHDAAGLV